MRDAAYILRDAVQSSQFRDCPAKCGTGGHPNLRLGSFYFNILILIMSIANIAMMF